MRSISDAVILLVADGLVAVGRLLGGLRRRCAAEKHADALAEMEAGVDHLEPGDLTAFGLTWPTKADKDRAFGELQDSLDRIAAAERGDLARPTLNSLLDAYWAAKTPEVETQALDDLLKYYPARELPDAVRRGPSAREYSREFYSVSPLGMGRSAAVSTPAADNTTDCGCGSDDHCPDRVRAQMDEDTAAAGGTELYDSLVALWDYHPLKGKWDGPATWGCEGCAWTGKTTRDHTLHRLALVADMKNATHRIQEQLGGAS